MHPVKINFSNEAQELIALARLEAIDLGYDYVSGNHFLIADCQLNKHPSIKQFAFADNMAFSAYYKTQRIQDPSVFKALDRSSLPITKVAEAMIKTAAAEAKLYGSRCVERHHLFLASCRNKDKLFVDNQDRGLDIYPRLLAYYRGCGLLLEARKSVPLIERIKNVFK